MAEFNFSDAKVKTIKEALELYDRKLTKELRDEDLSNDDRKFFLEEQLNVRDLQAYIWEVRSGFRTNKGL